MSALREGGSGRDGGPVSGPFAEIDLLGVVPCDCLSCSTEVKANVPSVESSVVDVRFGSVESLRHFSKRSEGFEDVVWISVATCVREVCEWYFGECESLRIVIFGASSKLERICDSAFCETSIESLSIPDSVVELGKGCFYDCMSLRIVIFGALSKLERICSEAFGNTSIESLSLPDSVVELGKRCFYDCKSLRNVDFGASSKLERI